MGGRVRAERAGRRLVWALIVTVPLSPHPAVPRLQAQSSPTVRAAVQLAAEGRGDSARLLLDGQLARARTGDSTWIETLYWRARLAPGGELAERDLRRIAVEYGNSPWADDALLQLSQLALAGGNPAAALDYGARLRADYPGSELRARAALWSGRAAFDVGEPRTACALLDSARAEAAGDVEFTNQVLFYRGRCTETALSSPPRPAPPRPDTARATPAHDSLIDIHRGTSAPSPPRVAGRFEVQVTAARTEAAARDIVRRLSSAGLRARIVAGGGVHRVRLGPYRTAAAAASAAASARHAVGGKPFVVRLP